LTHPVHQDSKDSTNAHPFTAAQAESLAFQGAHIKADSRPTPLEKFWLAPSQVPCTTAHKGMTFKTHDKFTHDCRLGTSPGIQQPFCCRLQVILPNPSDPTSQVTFISSTMFYSTTDSEYLAQFISVRLRHCYFLLSSFSRPENNSSLQ